MTSLPSSPADAGAPAAERRLAHVQTISTELLPAPITEHKRHDSVVTVPHQETRSMTVCRSPGRHLSWSDDLVCAHSGDGLGVIADFGPDVIVVLAEQRRSGDRRHELGELDRDPTVRYLPRSLWSTSTTVPLARSAGSWAISFMESTGRKALRTCAGCRRPRTWSCQTTTSRRHRRSRRGAIHGPSRL